MMFNQILYFLMLSANFTYISEQGISVCEAGCNTGVMAIHLAKLFPNSNFIAFDLSQAAIEDAKKQVGVNDLKNLRFFSEDIFKMPDEWIHSFDFIYFIDGLHDLSSPRDGLKCLYKILKKDGQLSLIDFDINSHIKDNIGSPIGSLLYSTSMLYCLSMSLYMGGSGAGSCYGKQKIREDLAEAGFRIDLEERLKGSTVELHYVCTKL